MFDFNGKSVLITGGEPGIGASLALRLSAEARKSRWSPAIRKNLMGRQGDQEARRDRLRNRCGRRRQGERLFDCGTGGGLAGPVDVLINNASALGPVPLQLIPDTDCEDFERALQVNTIGPFRPSRLVVGSMILRKTGVIVNISSDAAVEAYPSWGVYGASKASRSSDPDRGG